jgi:predicted nucleic acid-binding protein
MDEYGPARRYRRPLSHHSTWAAAPAQQSCRHGDDVQSGAETWQTWDTLVDDQRFRFAAEPEGFETQLRTLSTPFIHQPKSWQDAALAAFAIAADLELVTFDTGFRSFPGLRCRILSSEIGTK